MTRVIIKVSSDNKEQMQDVMNELYTALDFVSIYFEETKQANGTIMLVGEKEDD